MKLAKFGGCLGVRWSVMWKLGLIVAISIGMYGRYSRLQELDVQVDFFHAHPEGRRQCGFGSNGRCHDVISVVV